VSHPVSNTYFTRMITYAAYITNELLEHQRQVFREQAILFNAEGKFERELILKINRETVNK
jgi:hypothetical protein